MVRNACLNYLKHLQLVEQHNLEHLDKVVGQEELYYWDFNLSPEYTLLYKELQQQISLVMSDLPSRCREVFEMSRFKKMKNREIADAAGCGRNTVTRTLARAREQQLGWQQAQSMSQQEVSQRLFPTEQKNPVYKMPDYEWVHREMQKSGVTLSLLWVEYCEQCRQSGELPYKSAQFNKYYADYVHKTKATMHLEHKPGETMQVDWAGQTAALVDTDTGERLDAYLFVAVLPYSGYAYTEAFLDMKQEAWITGHVNAYRYFGGVTRILTPDNLKTGIVKNSRTETVLNKSYQEMSEHYGTAILPARPRSPNDKAFVEGSVGAVSTWILAALRNRQFLSLMELNESIHEKLETFNHKPFQKREGSRTACFAEEKLFLLPLPATPFELAVWKVATRVIPRMAARCTTPAAAMHHLCGSSAPFRRWRCTIIRGQVALLERHMQ